MTSNHHLVWLLLLAGCATAPVVPVALPPDPQQTVAIKATPKAGLVEESLTSSTNRPRNDDLVWQPVPGADGYRISAGSQRWQWSTNWVTKDNFVRHATNCSAYGVSAFNQFMETPVTPWPSNHFYIVVAEYFSDATAQKKLGELKLGGPTNAALFLRIRNQFDHSE